MIFSKYFFSSAIIERNKLDSDTQTSEIIGIFKESNLAFVSPTEQKTKFSIDDFFSKCDQIRRKQSVKSVQIRRLFWSVFGHFSLSETSDLVTFTEEIFNVKLYFLCSVHIQVTSLFFEIPEV